MLLTPRPQWSRGRGAQWLWLEVRASNLRAQQIHQTTDSAAGDRKRYYPPRTANAKTLWSASLAL